MKVQSNPTTLSGWIGWAIGASVMLIALLSIKILKFLMTAANKQVSAAIARNKVEPAKKADEADGDAVMPFGTGRDWSDYEPAITRCIQFPGIGYLLLWAYRGQSVIKCSVKLNDADLVKAVGAQVFPLKPMTWPADATVEQMEDRAIELTEQFLAQKCAGVKAKAVRKPEFTEKEAPSAAPALMAPPAKAAAPQPVKAKKRDANSYAHPASSAKAVETHVGVLQDAGVFPRTMGDRQFEQFGVDVFKPELGAPHRIWGTDLERAIEAADAKPGDRVRIDYTGSSRVVLPGEQGFTTMRHYVATVLERAR